MLKEALEAQDSRGDYRARNNEIVVSTRSVTTNLPESVEAFFVLPWAAGWEHDKVVNAWRDFARAYELTDEASTPPLLQLDVRRDANPFSVAASFRDLRT